MAFSEYTPKTIGALDTSSLGDMYVSYRRVNVPEVTVPTYDDTIAPLAMLAQGSFTKAVDNIKTKFSESPIFKFQYTSSGVTDLPSTQEASNSSSSSSSSTADFIKQEEGFKDHRYKDAEGQSIGYGFYGTRYYSGNHITREEADKVLDGIIKKQETNFSKYPVWNKLNNNQKTALHSYVYNVGSITSKLKDALLSEDLTKIHDAISITTSLGKRSEVLVKRRNKEKALFNS